MVKKSLTVVAVLVLAACGDPAYKTKLAELKKQPGCKVEKVEQGVMEVEVNLRYGKSIEQRPYIKTFYKCDDGVTFFELIR